MPRTARPGEGVGPWCSRCGRPVGHLRGSLVPDIQVGLCSFTWPDGRAGGCGWLPAIYDITVLRDTLEFHRRERAWKTHEKHVGVKRVVGCPVCDGKVQPRMISSREGDTMEPGADGRPTGAARTTEVASTSDRRLTEHG